MRQRFAQEAERKIKPMPKAKGNSQIKAWQQPGWARGGRAGFPSRSDPHPAQPVPAGHPAAPFAPRTGSGPALPPPSPGAAAPARSPRHLLAPTHCSLEDTIISQITKHQEWLCNLLRSLLHLLILKYFNGSFIAVLKSSERQ